MIYIISNVEYPESNKITPQKDDLLVFLNKARSISYYKDHENKIIFRRKPDSDYGSGFEGTKSYFVFDGPSDVTIPSAFITELKQNYDWKYDIEKGRKRCATTGYMVVKYIESQHPGEPITLVNFGYEVKIQLTDARGTIGCLKLTNYGNTITYSLQRLRSIPSLKLFIAPIRIIWTR